MNQPNEQKVQDFMHAGFVTFKIETILNQNDPESKEIHGVRCSYRFLRLQKLQLESSYWT